MGSPKTATDDIHQFRQAVLEQQLFPQPNLLLAKSLAQAAVKPGQYGGCALYKRKTVGVRDDLAAALILAVAHWSREQSRPRQQLVFATKQGLIYA